jgi:tRNA(His) guanylyltransferase
MCRIWRECFTICEEVMSNDSLGDRMKSYEDCYRTHLPIRMPVIIRVDGKAFHSYTKGKKYDGTPNGAPLGNPVDAGLVECMNDTAIALCEEIQGAQIAYVQSDEISILLNNYKTTDTQSWFDNTLQKMVSISSAVASVRFSLNSWKIWGVIDTEEVPQPIIEPAFFDARAFVLHKEEVCNYFIWRQQDATRNSVQMLARSLYSHRECTDKNNSELQELIFQKGINWNDCPIPQKRGRCVIKTTSPRTALNPKTGEYVTTERTKWVVDNDIPIFTVDRNYIDKYI